MSSYFCCFQLKSFRLDHERGARPLRLFGEEKTRYRLYKSGKLWLVALIGVFALAIGHQPSHVKASSVATRTATLAVQPATLGQELNLNNQQTINADSPTSSNEVVVKCVDDAGNTLVKDTVLQGEVGLSLIHI